MGVIFIYILVVVFYIFIRTIKQLRKFMSYLTTVTNSAYSFVPDW